MPLSYLRGIFLRCLAESNRCSRFCRPVPNRSAKAPFPYWDCKYSEFSRICKIYFNSSANILLNVQQQSFQVLTFRVVDVHGVVTRLVETVKDADTAATLSSR